MSSSPRIELLLLLSVLACNDPKVHPRPGADSGLPDTAIDSGGDTSTPEGCGPGVLSEEDGRPLRLSETANGGTDIEIAAYWFGTSTLPDYTTNPGKLWVSTGANWYADTRPNWDGAYLLDGTAWDGDGVLGPDARPTLFLDDGIAHTAMVATGLTMNSATQKGGFAITTPGTSNDDLDGSYIWLANSAPTRATDLIAWADVEIFVEAFMGDESTFADLNGDGLDDVLVPGYETRIFLSPMTGSVFDDDADFVFPAILPDEVAPFQPTSAAAVDLDHDGYLDLIWKQPAGERDNHTQFDLLFKRGPIARDWDAPDARIVDEVSALPENSWGSSYTQSSTVRAVGDVTGDGYADVTATFSYDAGGRDGSGSLIVIEAWPEGTVALEDVPTRLVGVPGDIPDMPSHSNLGSGGSGDVNGDGVDDLVVFQAYTGLYSGDERRVYIAPGPLSGLVVLEDASVQVRLPRGAGATNEHNAATVVPDLDGDGLDDVLVNAVDGGDLPGVVWLFAGCDAW